MLKLIPSDGGGQGAEYEVIFSGTDEAIDEVIQKRLDDQECNQLPRNREEVSDEYHVKVRYRANSRGRVEVKEISVLFATSADWNCFYDRYERCGDMSIGATPHHFLRGARDLIKRITRYEKGAAVKRLIHAGPKVFARRRVGDI